MEASPFSQNFWADISNQRRFARWLEGKLCIKQPSDWYLITGASLRNSELRASSLLNRYGQSVYKICCGLYPRIKWNAASFKRIGKTKRLMQTILVQEMKVQGVQLNYLHPDLRFSRSGRKMELDFWFPEKQLAIEYQGEYHDTPRGRGLEMLRLRQEMDAEKRAACAAAGITLVEIWHHQVKYNHRTIRVLLTEALSGHTAPVSLLRVQS